MPVSGEQPVVFGPFKLNPGDRSLARDGVSIALGGRAFDVLVLLASADGETVSKDTLLDKVWPGLTVEENNLQVQISVLRRALGDGWITTVPGRGYRLLTGPAAVTPPAGKPYVAVLAFDNLSGDRAQEYFSDGLADDIITELSRSQSLFVIARNSSFAYKGRAADVKQIARELGVRYLLQGSARHAAERVRVNAQLIDAESGVHIWAERYDRALADVFAVQDAITEAVTHAIAPAVADAELRRALRRPPENLGAWEAYQRGLWHAGKANAADNEVALGFFRRAIELDPAFASPHAMLAQNYGWGFTSGTVTPVSTILTLAEDEARRAIELDPDEPTAHAVLSWICMCNAEHGAALERAERAVAIAPSDPVAWLAKARVLVFSGRPNEATSALATTLRLSPRGPGNWMAELTLVVTSYFLGDYGTAAEVARKLTHEHPGLTAGYRWLAASLGQLDQLDEASKALHKALQLSRESFEFNVLDRPPWFRPEDHAHLVGGLQKAGWAGNKSPPRSGSKKRG